MRQPFLKQVNVINVPALTEEGEVYTAEKKIQIVQEDEEDFFFCYSYLNGYINDCTSMTDIKLLNWITLNVDFNNNVITLNKFYKTKIMEYTKIAMSSLDRSISNLVKAEILIKDENCPRCAMYFVNPAYVWKGNRGERKLKMKFVLEVIQKEKLPDMEKNRIEDIKRYEEHYHANK